jgi:DTW domain-containing protein YfiP
MNLDSIEKAKRIICASCIRPLKACICHCVRQIDSAVEVLILQHPLEKNHIKGSARLLHLCLPNSQLLIGDIFDEHILVNALYARGKTPVLLYPDSESDARSQREFNVEHENCENIRLVILDATWRKSHQLLANNPLLQKLKRWSLKDIPVSQYEIRHAQKVHQLSTLEACTYALLQLDKNKEKYAPLFLAFDEMIKLQLNFGVNLLKRVK